MATPCSAVDDIFEQALQLAGVDRTAFLDAACGVQTDLRKRVERLLLAAGDAGRFLESPALEIPPTIDQKVMAQTGAHIGHYKLLQEIGEGGMGVVYMAEQIHPVTRRVALKIIKPGMDSKQVIARFEAERQALSLMDHPNIAKVFDAGTTSAPLSSGGKGVGSEGVAPRTSDSWNESSGLPYFVMELVKGQPITHYCDEHQLTPRQRLELFLPVCHAIQHAHQKGVIHRDIKPSNILVAEYDNQPVPKVIDFGVAKAIHQPLTDKTMFTGFGHIVGTIEYMSPEQAKVNQLDIDTRSDIYSLGVLLYELLTGTTPFDKKRLRTAAFDELLRIIREEEPPKPSTRLSRSRDSLTAISAKRHTEPAKLTRLLQGDLDWIVMKALEKDRNRRYETANGMALDLHRFLIDEPVSACPPSRSYRLRKFVRRHRVGAFVALLLLFSALVLSVGGWFYQQAIQDADRSRQANESAQQVKAAHEKIGLVQAAIRSSNHHQAFELLQTIEPLIPNHDSLPALWEQCSQGYLVSSQPAGATIWVKPYHPPETSWREVMVTENHPVSIRLPRGEYFWRATKAGFREVCGLRSPRKAHFTLQTEATDPVDMIRVSGGQPKRPFMALPVKLPQINVPDFLVDRCEVTNAQFEQFVRAGGYANSQYWKDLPWQDEKHQPTSWERVKHLLVDQTGQPGPSTWRHGRYPPQEAEFPVRGVSWYEAMAFAQYSGKRLPSVYHWVQASRIDVSVVLAGEPFITRSNFGSRIQSVTSLTDYNLWGLLGMAGNVKEWSSTQSADGKRFILGGSIGEPIYVPLTLESRDPLHRQELFGFRCMKPLADQPGASELWQACGAIQWPPIPPVKEFVDAETFRLTVRDRFVYEHSLPLDPVLSTKDEGDWIHHIVQINTAYRDPQGRLERMTVHLYLPKTSIGQEGFQTIIYGPAADALMLPRVRNLSEEYGLDTLARSGRAVAFPILQGMYERRYSTPAQDDKTEEDQRLCQGLDLMRCVDYLQQRPELNMKQLGYYGFSLGAQWNGSLIAAEPRIQAAVFEAAGLGNDPWRKDRIFLNWRLYLPHLRIPILMLSGELDPIYPVNEAQKPMFKLLGSSIKEHYIHPGGHHMLPPPVKFKHIERWFDQHLGKPAKIPAVSYR